MAAQIHWVLILALSLMMYWYFFFSFLPAEITYLFKAWEHSAEIKAFHCILILPLQFPRVASLYNYNKTTKENLFKPFREARISFCLKTTFTSQKPDVELASSCWLDWSVFQRFLISNIFADYHIVDLTLLPTGLVWFVTIQGPLELATGSQAESSASQQQCISYNTKYEIWT